MSKKKYKDYFRVDYKKKSFYKFYSENYKKKVDQHTYNKILTDCNLMIGEKLLEGFAVRLPFGLGTFSVRRTQPKIVFDEEGKIDFTKSRISTDWGATNKLWKEKPELAHKKYIFHENIETEGYIFKIIWSPFRGNAKNIRAYKFVPSKMLKQRLKEYILTNNKIDYDDFRLHKPRLHKG
jgi:nucleoid DNA-binding protein